MVNSQLVLRGTVSIAKIADLHICKNDPDRAMLVVKKVEIARRRNNKGSFCLSLVRVRFPKTVYSVLENGQRASEERGRGGREGENSIVK